MRGGLYISEYIILETIVALVELFLVMTSNIPEIQEIPYIWLVTLAEMVMLMARCSGALGLSSFLSVQLKPISWVLLLPRLQFPITIAAIEGSTLMVSKVVLLMGTWMWMLACIIRQPPGTVQFV